MDATDNLLEWIYKRDEYSTLLIQNWLKNLHIAGIDKVDRADLKEFLLCDITGDKTPDGFYLENADMEYITKRLQKDLDNKIWEDNPIFEIRLEFLEDNDTTLYYPGQLPY